MGGWVGKATGWLVGWLETRFHGFTASLATTIAIAIAIAIGAVVIWILQKVTYDVLDRDKHRIEKRGTYMSGDNRIQPTALSAAASAGGSVGGGGGGGGSHATHAHA